MAVSDVEAVMAEAQKDGALAVFENVVKRKC